MYVYMHLYVLKHTNECDDEDVEQTLSDFLQMGLGFSIFRHFGWNHVGIKNFDTLLQFSRETQSCVYEENERELSPGEYSHGLMIDVNMPDDQ